MKINHLALLAVLAVSAHSASAQTSSSDPRSSSGSSSSLSSPSGSAAGAGATTAGGDSGNISNLDSSASGGVGLSPDAALVPAEGGELATGELANTGGEPLLMALAGFALASGGLLLRRKLA